MGDIAESVHSFESLLHDLGDCGFFQIFTVLSISFGHIGIYIIIYIMAYGLYNPGWKCLDDGTATPFVNHSSSTGNKSEEYAVFSCDGFDTCSNVEFNPKASTLVTEWGLTCGKSWVPALIIVMSNVAAGLMSPVVGYCADRFGRKKTVQVGFFSLAVLNIVAIFSGTWEMYMGVQILMGLSNCLVPTSNILIVEFLPPKWRGLIAPMPTWCVCAVSASILAMVTTSWRALHIYSCVMLVIASSLLFLLPESVRWLTVNGREAQAAKAIEKIAKYNRRDAPQKQCIRNILETNSKEDKESMSWKDFAAIFTKHYGAVTFAFCFMVFSLEMQYFAIMYGVSALPGNIFENMIILTVSELPANPVAVFCGNYLGRRKSLFSFLSLEALTFFGVVAAAVFGPEDQKALIMLVTVSFAKFCLNVSFYVLVTALMETFPTTIRTTATGVVTVFTFVGRILAPFAIPDNPDTLYIKYLAMAVLALICCLLVCLIPETKGKQLKDTLTTTVTESDGIMPAGDRDGGEAVIS